MVQSAWDPCMPKNPAVISSSLRTERQWSGVLSCLPLSPRLRIKQQAFFSLFSLKPARWWDHEQIKTKKTTVKKKISTQENCWITRVQMIQDERQREVICLLSDIWTPVPSGIDGVDLNAGESVVIYSDRIAGWGCKKNKWIHMDYLRSWSQ